MLSKSRTGALAGLIAAASMIAVPASAAQASSVPSSEPAAYDHLDYSRYDGDSEIAQNHRYYRYPRYRRGPDAGDVLTGVLILGGIAAIANAAERNRYRDREYRRYPDYDRRYRDYDRRYENRRNDDRRYDDRRYDNSRSDVSGLDNAADRCVARIEQDRRVESVDGVDRNANGWTVRGQIENGGGFTCRIDNNGRVSDVDYDGYRGAREDDRGEYSDIRANEDDGQWSDARYTEARRAAGPQAPGSAAVDQLPAYPGGPLPGEEYPEEGDASIRG